MNSNRNNTSRWIAIIVSVLVILSSLGITFAMNNAKRITKHDTSLAVIQNELKHLNLKMDEVLEEIKK